MIKLLYLYYSTATIRFRPIFTTEYLSTLAKASNTEEPRIPTRVLKRPLLILLTTANRAPKRRTAILTNLERLSTPPSPLVSIYRGYKLKYNDSDFRNLKTRRKRKYYNRCFSNVSLLEDTISTGRTIVPP